MWLSHILSQADHRLNHVEAWAEKRLHPRRRCTAQRVHPRDVGDDHLAAVLEALSDDGRWSAFEGTLNQHLLRVDDLQPACGRLDSTTASGYGTVTEAGLFQVGHRQAHRPDLPQVKVMLSALDPLGMPVATDVVAGQRAEDPLDVPAIARVREGRARRGLRYVGDGQLGALEPRAFIHAGGDDSLGPLSELHVPPAVLAAYLAPVWTGEPAVTPLSRVQANGERELSADGFAHLKALTAVVGSEGLRWTERRLVIRSHQLAQAGEPGLCARLAQAQAAIVALNDRRQGKRRVTELPALQEAVAALVARSHVQGLVQVRSAAHGRQRPVRRYGSRSATVRQERDMRVTASVDQGAVAAAGRRLGWRVYATTQPADQLPLAQAVLAYRHEYRIERDMGRLKGRSLSLTPMYLERDDHATGLIRLRSLGLRVLTLLEFVVRRGLAAAHTTLAGLDVGNPTRSTPRPTAERLLEAFQDLTLSIIRERGRRQYHLTPLARLHQRILALLGFPADIDTRLCGDSRKPP
jgi:transposase